MHIYLTLERKYMYSRSLVVHETDDKLFTIPEATAGEESQSSRHRFGACLMLTMPGSSLNHQSS